MNHVPWIIALILLLGLSGFLGITACYYSRKSDIYEHESAQYQRMFHECTEGP
ncbi:MAG: hypothetical protein KKC37_17125 [Proteobacteria bacterium]|nr:hypothetical protein [Pseudomonadota bacterium]